MSRRLAAAHGLQRRRGNCAALGAGEHHATRRTIFDRFCDEPTIMRVTHCPSTSTARVRRWADGYRFIPVRD